MTQSLLQLENEQALRLFSKNSEAMYIINTDTKYAKDVPSTPVLRYSSLPYEIWGKDNRLPQNWYKQGSRHEVIKSAMVKKSQVATCGGWHYGTTNSTGEFVPFFDAQISAFLDNLDLDQYFEAAFQNLYWYGMFCPEILLDIDNRVRKIHLIETPYVRFGSQDDYGQLHEVFLHSDWYLYRQNYQKLPLLSPYLSLKEASQQIKDDNQKSLKNPKYVLPTLVQTANADSVYPDPTWVSVLSNWLDFSLKIPQFKRAYIENALNIKYIIYIDDIFWEQKYKDEWKTKPELRKQRIEETVQELETKMTEVSNAGKSFVSFSKNVHGTQTLGVTIKEIERSRPDSNLFLDDVEVSNLQIFNSLNFPVALMGNAIGKNGLGDNLGSGIRETLNYYLMCIRQEQNLVLKPINFILEHNGYVGVKVQFRQPYMQTLADVSPNKRQTTPQESKNTSKESNITELPKKNQDETTP